MDDESKQFLKQAIQTAAKNRDIRSTAKEAVFKHLKETYKETYKERYINVELMPFITINEVCVMDITNRNRGFVMNSDVNTMKKYIHELLIPGVLVNFTNGVLTTIVWFCKRKNNYLFDILVLIFFIFKACVDSQLGMEIEILEEMPSGERFAVHFH